MSLSYTCLCGWLRAWCSKSDTQISVLETEIRGHTCTRCATRLRWGCAPATRERPAWRPGWGSRPTSPLRSEVGWVLKTVGHREEVVDVLTASKIDAGSVDYYESTVDREERNEAGFDYVDYAGERGDSVPTAFVFGDDSAELAALATFGVEDQEEVSEETVRSWLAKGESPVTGEKLGRATKNTGFDLTFSVPKSVSLIYALGSDEQRAAVEAATKAGERAALAYLAEHSGYTRRHNSETGKKDLERLSTFAGASYPHRASRTGDPSVHSHNLVSNRQVRQDGSIASIDGTSLYHELRAAGMVGAATVRAAMTQSLGLEWNPVNERTGLADVAGFTPEQIEAWSQRSDLIAWAQAHGMEGTTAQLDIARRATRQAKQYDGRTAEQVIADWQADERAEGIDLSADGPIIGRAQAAEVEHPQIRPEPETVLAHLAQTKSTFTRADIVESVGTLWPTATDPTTVREEIEAVASEVAAVALPLVERDRLAHEREGSLRFTCPEVIQEEARLLVAATATDEALSVEVDEMTAFVALEGLSDDQRQAVEGIASSAQRVTPLIAPAGAGKTYSLAGLRAVYESSGRELVGLAPSGRAADQLRADGVTESARTVASWKSDADQGRCDWGARTVVVVDEAGMVGTADLAQLVEMATERGAKVVTVGDPRQLAAVKQRGGALDLLARECESSQQLSEVWRQRDETERSVGLLIRDGDAEALAVAAEWYDSAERLHAGTQTAMLDDAYAAWQADRAEGVDSLFLASSWEYADAANLRAQADAGTLADEDAPRISLSRGQAAGVGDVVMTRRNDYSLTAWTKDPDGRSISAGTVMNSHRWQVESIGPDGAASVTRLADGATATLPSHYLSESAHLGYAGTIHAAQGATAERVHTLMDADTTQRTGLYVGATRGRESTHLYMAQRGSGDAEHEWTTSEERERQTVDGGRASAEEARAQFEEIAARDDRQVTAHQAMREARESEQLRLIEDQERKQEQEAEAQRRENRSGDDERRSEPTEELSPEEAHRHQQAEHHRKQAEQAERDGQDDSRRQSGKGANVTEEHQGSEQRQPQEREQAPQETRAEQVSKSAAEVKRDELLARKNKFQAKTEAAQAQRAQSQSQDSGQSL